MSSISQRPFTGRHMLMIMLAFFGVIFAVNFTMVYFAVSSWTGLVVKNSYVASQEFNETTAALEKAAAGVHALIVYDKDTLTITLNDDKGIAVAASTVAVTLGRPSHEGEDQTIALSRQADGVYTAKIALPKGQWSGRITANIPGHDGWQRPLRIMVKE
jgi:nitrogen fixation protein FixH